MDCLLTRLRGRKREKRDHSTLRELTRLTRCVQPVGGQKRQDMRKPESVSDRESVRTTQEDSCGFHFTPAS